MFNFLLGLNFIFNFVLFIIGTNITKIAISIATTPPNLDGIARKIAYAKRKYHSGWMWVGVTSGDATM